MGIQSQVDLDSGSFIASILPPESWNSNNKLGFDLMWQKYKTVTSRRGFGGSEKKSDHSETYFKIHHRTGFYISWNFKMNSLAT